jgi:hypothetical protein
VGAPRRGRCPGRWPPDQLGPAPQAHRPEFTSSIVSENLALVGIIGQELYDEIALARAARNRWAHGLEPVIERPAASAFFAGQTLVGLLTGCQLGVPIGLGAPRL